MASLYRIASNQYWGGSTCFGKTFFIFYLINFYWSEILYSWQILPKEIFTKIHPTHLPLHIEVFVWCVHLYLSFISLIFILFILPHFPSQDPDLLGTFMAVGEPDYHFPHGNLSWLFLTENLSTTRVPYWESVKFWQEILLEIRKIFQHRMCNMTT